MQDRNHADKETNGFARDLTTQDGNSFRDPFAKHDATEPFPATKEQHHVRKTSHPENKRPNTDTVPLDPTDENSKWIHRDKLARIESEELQAAGIILPKPRAQSRPRRERSTEKMNGHRRTTDASDGQPLPRSRKNSTLAPVESTPEMETNGWDFRLPDEIAEDPGDYWVKPEPTGTKVSRIPIPKASPVPIPVDHLERDTPLPRKQGGLVPDEGFSLTMPKARSRSSSIPALEEATKVQPAKRAVTEGSPKKKATTNGPRKPSAAAKQGSTRTRTGPSRDSGCSTNGARPNTRSGDLSPISKSAPEGEPPWMISAYKPDPRLPPDQQLLPTVARRLQQEQWEKEGKFGNIYDREFRPLNDEGYLRPPELQKPAPTSEDDKEKHDEWPLRPEAKSPTSSRPGTSSYSTMPRIQDKPVASPLASPRSPHVPTMPSQITRIPDPPQESREKESKRGGCGCCLVM
ncbi:uncharacterized protein BCR38DRAFT_453913 [Pseudomassariella vexata]|uniref:TeaA receptor TeaR n=1 Tax=Pseudomassariella vexata TaxID=1141098 RepID=A0A1Y2EID8_9PEZI|nr:uncharacterized protein BCR38DRAFT_453913 [Pseudomassariella vexata]ORY71349.1 hypothetical protein BCR38DRAFT_453913 [Pseudomassariella vexata]